MIKAIASYHLLNHLLPGVLFALFADALYGYGVVQEELVLGVFLYFFIGVVISRIGSLLVEPSMKKIGILKFAPYASYVAAAKADDTLATLSETNNAYRTYCSLFLCLLLLGAYTAAAQRWPILDEYSAVVAVMLLLFLFATSYAKQTRYIEQRVKAHEESL